MLLFVLLLIVDVVVVVDDVCSVSITVMKIKIMLSHCDDRLFAIVLMSTIGVRFEWVASMIGRMCIGLRFSFLYLRWKMELRLMEIAILRMYLQHKRM